MKKYNWSTPFLARDPVTAIDEFREDVVVEVSQNYFIYDRRPDDAPRSATIAISLSGSDREKTVAMLQEIGDAILQEQTPQRGERLAQARVLVEAQLASARSRTKSCRRRSGGCRPRAGPPGSARPSTGRRMASALGIEAR